MNRVTPDAPEISYFIGEGLCVEVPPYHGIIDITAMVRT